VFLKPELGAAALRARAVAGLLLVAAVAAGDHQSLVMYGKIDK
jgi:hypothetical protein